MTSCDVSGACASALDAVRDAGDIIRDHWSRPRRIDFKSAIELVTETDVAVEQFLRQRLQAILPQAGFIGEETTGRQPLPELAWIVDPVDGTTNFAHGLPFIAVSVGLWSVDRVVAGIVYNPIQDDLFWGVRGEGAFRNASPIAVSRTGEMKNCLAATGFPYEIEEYADAVLAWMGATIRNCRGVRRCGSAALDLAYVACGVFDVFYEATLKPWDTAAGWLLVEEAGGRVSRFDNTPYEPGAPSVLASNGLLHDPFSAMLLRAWDFR